MWKPRLRWAECLQWQCSGKVSAYFDFTAYGATPAKAYAAWAKLGVRDAR